MAYCEHGALYHIHTPMVYRNDDSDDMTMHAYWLMLPGTKLTKAYL